MGWDPMATDEYAKLFKRAWGDRDYTALNAELVALLTGDRSHLEDR